MTTAQPSISVVIPLYRHETQATKMMHEQFTLTHHNEHSRESLEKDGMGQLQSLKAQLPQGFSIRRDGPERISQAFPRKCREHFLPRTVTPKAPPIKTQGIKTKVVPLIARSINWSGDGMWIEPFLGSGAVALNIGPRNATLADTNAHLIRLYRDIKEGAINGYSIRAYLEREGAALLNKGEGHYYTIRDRFNESGDPFDFIFLSRSCFNGMMRFNKSGRFNVPFCRKPERFRPALVTKIVNQVEWARKAMDGKNWRFMVQDWRTTLACAQKGDMIYCDPPYVGRHTNYYNGFTDDEADALARALIGTPAGFALSMWLENKYRRNHYVDRWFSKYPQRTMSHFYHVGSSKSLRNQMTEAVILSKDVAVLSDAPSPFASGLPLFEAAEAINV